jgi:iron complex transport system substrate-binding protein
MRVISLLASGTEIVCALGAGESLVGRSHECDNPAWVASLPSCSEPAFDAAVSSREIDCEVNRRIRSGEPLYRVHSERIRDLAPDIIITQGHCEVCAVTPRDLDRNNGRAPAEAQVVTLSASTLDDIFDGVMQVARALGLADRGREVVSKERARLQAVQRRTEGRPHPTVVVLEWTDPMFVMGNWGPDLVKIAHGEPLLLRNQLGSQGNDLLYSFAIPADRLREADPDFLIVAPCGFDLERSWRERTVLEALPWWNELKAVQEGRVAFADGNRLFNRSGMTVAETAEAIEEILHGPGPQKTDEKPVECVRWRWYTNARVQAL